MGVHENQMRCWMDRIGLQNLQRLGLGEDLVEVVEGHQNYAVAWYA